MGIRDKLVAYLFDGAVVTFGTVIENALLERVEVGMGATKKSIAKYTLKQLLDPEFHLPRAEQGGGMDMLKGADGGFYDEVG